MNPTDILIIIYGGIAMFTLDWLCEILRSDTPSQNLALHHAAASAVAAAVWPLFFVGLFVAVQIAAFNDRRAASLLEDDA